MLGTLFSLVTHVFKWVFFTILVLIAGQLVHWRGRSVSDHVKGTLAAVDEWARPAKAIAERTRERVEDLSKQIEVGTKAEETEKISAAERARLRKIFSN